MVPLQPSARAPVAGKVVRAVDPPALPPPSSLEGTNEMSHISSSRFRCAASSARATCQLGSRHDRGPKVPSSSTSTWGGCSSPPRMPCALPLRQQLVPLSLLQGQVARLGRLRPEALLLHAPAHRRPAMPALFWHGWCQVRAGLTLLVGTLPELCSQRCSALASVPATSVPARWKVLATVK